MFDPEVKLAKELKDEFKTLTEFEALTIACQIRNNNILKSSFGAGEHHSDPPAFLEAIAIALGFSRQGGTSSSIPSSLQDIAEAISQASEN